MKNKNFAQPASIEAPSPSSIDRKTRNYRRAKLALTGIAFLGLLSDKAINTAQTADIKSENRALELNKQRADEKTRRYQEWLAKADEKIAQQQRMLDRAIDVAGNYGIDSQSLTAENLAHVEDLPGYEHAVSPEQHEQLQKASVKIAIRQAGTEEPWREYCSGTIVSVDGKTYASTAAHCVASTPNSREATSANLTPSNLTQSSPYQYAILDLSRPADKRSLEPIALVTGVAADTSGATDLALMSLKSTPPSKGQSLEDMTPLRVDDTVNPKTLRGQEVALYAAPGANGESPLVDTGTFLGRMYEANGVARDVVYVQEGSVADMLCRPGSSGSGAMTAEGATFGPLHWSAQNAVNAEEYMAATGIQDRSLEKEQAFMLYLEERTGVALPDEGVVCGFGVVQPDDYRALAQVMETEIGAIANVVSRDK